MSLLGAAGRVLLAFAARQPVEQDDARVLALAVLESLRTETMVKDPDVGPSIDAHLAREDAAEQAAARRESALDEMLDALTAGDVVVYGAGSAKMLTADDVHEAFTANDLRDACRAEDGARCRALWDYAARRVCERHVDRFLEWRSAP